ncbi:MAG: hypothetical protein HUU04_05390 [Verrucomicrobiae bacterium]|nr:hypothetical protein [Verrucomicrobiae bacterium]
MKSTPSFRLIAGLAALAFAVWVPSGKAVLLDWDLYSWTPSALTQSFDIDPLNPGNDITITITGDTGKFNLGYPVTATAPFTGGLAGPPSALQNLLTFDNKTQAVTYTVDFHYASGVTDVAFTLFDIDAGVADINQPIDQIRGNVATLTDSSTMGPTSLTGSVQNTVTGSGLSQVVTGTGPAGNTSADGNAAFQYNGAALSQFVFTFGNDAAAYGSGLAQGFALGDINFTPVPEAGAVLACATAGLIGVWGLRRMRRATVDS